MKSPSKASSPTNHGRTYDKDVFFRIALYRDMDMPAKPDFTNIRYAGKTTCKDMQKRYKGYLLVMRATAG